MSARFWLAVAILLAAPTLVPAQQTSNVAPRIAAAVDISSRVTIPQSKHPLAQPAFDVGPLDGTTLMQHMVLVLGVSSEQGHELATFLDSQQTQGSSDYHNWLTPDQFGQRFGPAPQDIQVVTGWLQQQGFTVESVARSGRWIEFSGTSAQVEAAFQTQMRRYLVNGEAHVANASNISIPAALAPVVRGVASLHNFFSKPMHVQGAFVRRTTNGMYAPLDGEANLTVGHGLSPADFAKIYDVPNLLLSPAPPTVLNGTGETIAIVARTDINAQDVADFRTVSGLPAATSSNPNFILNGADPGIVSLDDQVETTLDTEWSGAVAPAATIDVVISQSTLIEDGVDLSSAYIVDHNLAPVMSVSFAGCEAFAGSGVGSQSEFFNSLWQQAAAQGISVFVASGDDGAAGCDPNGPVLAPGAVEGVGINALSSPWYDTAVGGTEFNESITTTNFWNPVNTTNLESAVGYIPEMVWNDSCSTGCDEGFDSLEAGGGGVSVLYTTPPYQTLNVSGLQTTLSPFAVSGVTPRAVPDVSLAASPNHDGYLLCLDFSCEPTTNPGFLLVGGTSASSPAFAGIMALVDQKLANKPQGLANYVLYPLAAAETYSACNSSSRTDPTAPTACVFNDNTVGNNGVPGNDVTNDPISGALGYPTGTGFDLASGLGSVDANNLINAWGTSAAAFFGTQTTITSPASINITHGTTVAITSSAARLSTDGTTLTPTGTIALMAQGGPFPSPVSIGSTTLSGSGGTAAGTAHIGDLPGGSYTLFANYPGDGTFAGSASTAINVTVAKEAPAIELTDVATGSPTISNTPITVSYGTPIAFEALISGLSSVNSVTGDGAATGTVTFTGTLGSTTTNLSPAITLIASAGADSGFAEFFDCSGTPSTCPTTGVNTINGSYSGDNSYTAGNSGTSNPSFSLLVTITAANTSTSVSSPASGTTVLTSTPVTLNAAVATSSGSGNAPNGTVTFFSGATRLGSPVAVTGTAGNQTFAGAGTSASAIASLTTTLPAGTDNITAIYNGDTGDSNYAASSASTPITITAIGQAATTTTVSASPNPSTVGQNVTLTATVSSTQSGPAITGTVTFSEGGTTIGSAPVSGGQAILMTTALPLGTFTIKAAYSGDSNYTGSSGTTITTFTVNNPAPALTGIAPTSGIVGQTVSPLVLSGSGFLASSTVNFGSNQITGGTVGSGGTTLTVTVPASDVATAGPVSVTVTNAGPGGGTSNSQTFTVNATGPPTVVRVETKPDGTGTVVPGQNVAAGTAVTGYAISRDASGRFVANVSATWSLTNPTGGVVAGDLVASGDSKSATFTGHVVGTAAMHAVASGLASTDSGTLTVVAGTATAVRVETKPDGTGTVVPGQNVATGTSVTGYAVSRDASGNFVANVAATWSLASISGGVVSSDLVPAGDSKSAAFTGHLVGTAAIHAAVSGLVSTDSGTLTVVAGTATAVRVETKADGTGTVVPAQNVVAGTSVTGFAISRDASGNFVANVAATWSLTNPTGGVVAGNLVPSGDSKSATFTGHALGSAAIHAVVSGLASTDSGTLTVVAGTATAVRVETKADGTGTVVPVQNVVTGTSLTGYAISRDASGNFVANVGATWSLANPTGGVVAGDLVPSGDGKSTTFTGHLVGTATIHAVVSGLASTDSGILTVVAGTATAVRVETKADGTGTLVPAQSLGNGNTLTAFAISRDASGNFVANVPATWSLANITGGVVSTDLIAAGDSKSATFTGHLAGTATIHAVASGLASTDSGTITVLVGSIVTVRVETKPDGSGIVVVAQNVPSGTSVIGYAVGRDGSNNPVANVAAAWSLSNVTGGVASGDLVPAGDGKSATFTGHLAGSAAMHAVFGGASSVDSGALTVTTGAATNVRVETKPDGTGTVVPAQNVVAGTSVTGYAISRDAGGNFIANVAATWSLANISGGVVSSDLVSSGDSKSATFTGHVAGTAAMHAVVSALASTDSGTLTVVAGTATAVRVETKPDGTGTLVPAQSLGNGNTLTAFAISRDASGNFVANVAATWSLANITGGIVGSDLVPAGDSKSATFTGHVAGTAAIHAVVSGLASTDSGTLTVVAGTATSVRVETKPDGTGTVVPAQNVATGSSVTGYAISRDASGNFVSNVSATWSLANISGGVVSSDLVASGDNKSAAFTGHVAGTAAMHAVVGGLVSTDSGTLTVVAGTATVVRVETKPDGTGTVVPAQNVAAGSSVRGYTISRDASGNFVANVAATWSLANISGGVVSTDLAPAGDSKSALFNGHLVGMAAIHAVVSGLVSTDSGTLTVTAGTATAVRVETKPDGTGTVVPAQNVATGSSVTVYAISRDADGNFVANIAATWSLTNPTGAVGAGNLVPSGDGKSATFNTHGLGSAAIHAAVSGLVSTDSGTLTVVAGTATVVRVETKADGTGTAVPAQNVGSGSSVTVYAISRDPSGDFIANVAATWSLANPTGGVVAGDLVASGDSKSATFTGHLVGTGAIHVVASGLIPIDSGTLTVVAGTATAVRVEAKPDGTGTVVPAQNVVAGTSITGYAISRDASGNFVANVAATWSLTNPTGGVVAGNLVPSGDSKSATFTGHALGSAAIHTVVSGLTSTDSGTLTVVAGTATAVRVETKADGTGTVVPAQNVVTGTSLTGYAISRDSSGNFVGNVAATWSLANISGGVVSSDLVSSGDSKSATFTGHVAGTAAIHAVVSGLASTDSGTLTVVASIATMVRVETQPDGSGALVPAQNVSAGNSITAYAISRDAAGAFIANVAATWSLTNPAGGVVAGDLVPSGDGKSATFTGHVTGTATIHTVSGALTSTDSGTITVVAGAAAKLLFGAQPSNSYVGAAIAPAVVVTITDAVGNPVTTATNLVTMAIGTNPSGGTLGGTTGVAAVNGAATFPNLSINNAGRDYSLTASAVGLTGATSAAFNNVGIAMALTTTGTLPVTAGTPASVTFNLTITPVGAPLPATVNYACSVPASLSATACAMNPSSTAAGKTSGSTTLTLTTTAEVPPPPRPDRPQAPFVPWLALGAFVGAMGLYFAGRQKLVPWRVRPAYLALALVVIAATGTVGCTTSMTATTTTSTSTPKGPATITVTATSGGVESQVQVNIDVN